MVAPIRDLANILFSNFPSAIQTLQMAQSPSAMDMNMDMNIIRERSALSSKNGLRESSISLSNFSQAYYE